MATRWIYEMHIVVAASERDMANGMAALMDPDRGGANTFMLPLALLAEVNPEAAPACYGAVTAATETMHQAMNVVVQRGLLTTVRYWRLDATTGELLETNSPMAIASTGTVWSWAQTLADAGLKAIGGRGQ